MPACQRRGTPSISVNSASAIEACSRRARWVILQNVKNCFRYEDRCSGERPRSQPLQDVDPYVFGLALIRKDLHRNGTMPGSLDRSS